MACCKVAELHNLGPRFTSISAPSTAFLASSYFLCQAFGWTDKLPRWGGRGMFNSVNIPARDYFTMFPTSPDLTSSCHGLVLRILMLSNTLSEVPFCRYNYSIAISDSSDCLLSNRTSPLRVTLRCLVSYLPKPGIS